MNLPNCPKCGSKGRFYHSNEVEFACTSVMRKNVIAVESAGCLRIQRDQLQERIKRLEEAGDALKAAGYFGGWADAVNKWIKVREDKP